MFDLYIMSIIAPQIGSNEFECQTCYRRPEKLHPILESIIEEREQTKNDSTDTETMT